MVLIDCRFRSSMKRPSYNNRPFSHYREISDLSLDVLTLLSLGQYTTVWGFPVMTSLSVNKWYISAYRTSMTCWNIIGALCKTNGISKSGALHFKLPGAYCTSKSDMNMTKNWNIWPVRYTHKTLRPLCTFRPHEYCLIGKEENKVTIKQASWFIPGTVVCILTRSWEKLCNRVKGLLKVVMKVFLGGGGGGTNLIKQCSLLIQQNSYFLVTVTVC